MRTYNVSGASRFSCATKGFLCFLPIEKERFLRLPVFFPGPYGRGGGHRGGVCAPRVGVPFGGRIASVLRLPFDVSDAEYSVGLGSLRP